MKTKILIILFGGSVLILLILMGLLSVVFSGYYIYNKYVAASPSTEDHAIATVTTMTTSTSSVSSSSSISSTTTIRPTTTVETTSTTSILPMPEGSKCNEDCWQKPDNSYCEIETRVLRFTDSGGYNTRSVTYQGYCKKCMCYSLSLRK